MSLLGPADLRFCNLVAVRRFGGEPGGDDRSLAEAVAWPDAVEEGRPRFGTPFLRSAAIAEATVRVFPEAALPTALLVLCAHLRREGYQLVAPQGVLAGMLRGLRDRRTSVEEVARWLEDRAIRMP